uniref:Uncharacterized protein n=1 Tax=Rhizophora mucronata TaxID=61149 RepID=A0A2P2NEF9_RHIMU
MSPTSLFQKMAAIQIIFRFMIR